jgi:hypothetical protein
MAIWRVWSCAQVWMVLVGGWGGRQEWMGGRLEEHPASWSCMSHGELHGLGNWCSGSIQALPAHIRTPSPAHTRTSMLASFQVAAGSLVLKPVPPRTMVAGTPAREVGVVRGNPAQRMEQWCEQCDPEEGMRQEVKAEVKGGATRPGDCSSEGPAAGGTAPPPSPPAAAVNGTANGRAEQGVDGAKINGVATAAAAAAAAAAVLNGKSVPAAATSHRAASAASAASGSRPSPPHQPPAGSRAAPSAAVAHPQQAEPGRSAARLQSPALQVADRQVNLGVVAHPRVFVEGIEAGLETQRKDCLRQTLWLSHAHAFAAGNDGAGPGKGEEGGCDSSPR